MKQHDHEHHHQCHPHQHEAGMSIPPTRPESCGFIARITWAWQWFWFVFTKNRFAIAVASLVWILLRSGSQPRRLNYPCQQAAAANLGFLAVLFVPALARRRRRRVGSSWPQIAELATGSVVLAGILFILVSEGAQVYSELTAAWSPGNPAVILWTSVQPSSQAELSPHVITPSNAESLVAVNRNTRVSYGVQPYGPDGNSAYELVWDSVADLHLGPYDNPLRDLVTDMDGDGTIEVFIKPNTVEHFSDSNGERSPVYVHPAMIRPLVDMAARAGAHQISVGDGSDGTGTYFTSKMDPMGYTEAYFNQMRTAWPGVNIARVDLHSPKRFSWVNLGAQTGGASAYVGSGYTSSQLQKARDGAANAYFNAKDSHDRSGPGASNCMGWLAIADALLDADVVIDLAKLKVHYLGVNTAALKNWVGITMFSTYEMNNIYGCRLAHNIYGAGNYEMEFGNDILWRELVDAHRAVMYSRGQTIETTPQRRYLCIIDAINCGERYHVPDKPWPYWLDTVLASVDPVAVDAVASRLQMYKFGRIPIVNNAHAVSISSSRPLGTADPAEVRVVGNTGIDSSNYNHLFAWESAQDKTLSWPDWGATTVTDLQPPTISSWTRQNLAGSWQLTAQIADCYAAYFYYGDNGDGAPNVVRLARNGTTFTAALSGAITDGVLIAQDNQFNTAQKIVTDRAIMEVSENVFKRTAMCRQGLIGNSFTVRNVGPSVLNYTVQVDPAAQSWLSVSPGSGSSAGEPDTIIVNYNIANLTPGTYSANITVSDPASYSVQKTVKVNLVLSGYRADFDGDNDVDQEDYAHLQLCLTGDLNPQTSPTCTDARLDGDTDVDTNDVGLFLQCLSGSGIPAGPCCAP